MKRREFIKKLGLLSAGLLLPFEASANAGDTLAAIQFDKAQYEKNNAQIIMVYLYGGASELGGNLSNFEQIQERSKNKYDPSSLTQTVNNFWGQAGGEAMERMLESGDMKLFRTCYRQDHPTKSHSICTAEMQRGIYHQDPTLPAGVFSILGKALSQNDVITDSSIMPFLTMEGNSGFFNTGTLDLEFYLKAAAIGEKLDNPYKRKEIYEAYSAEEWKQSPRPSITALSREYDKLAATMNKDEKVQDAFNKGKLLSQFIDDIAQKPIPDGISYPQNSFATRLKSSVKILVNNPDTKIISVGSRGLGGWDDHSNAISHYSERMQNLMVGIEAAMTHIKAEGRDNISIMVLGEFGRNVNLNDSKGWDHGNNQNIYFFGGQRYFNSIGIVGETELASSNNINRLYTKPTAESYTFEPYSIAATLYKLYGITNPEVLTGGYASIKAGLYKTS